MATSILTTYFFLVWKCSHCIMYSFCSLSLTSHLLYFTSAANFSLSFILETSSLCLDTIGNQDGRIK